MITTPNRRLANNGVPVGKVPVVAGTCFLRPRDPPMARTAIMGRMRPASITIPSVVLYQRVFADSPPKADPLLLKPWV